MNTKKRYALCINNKEYEASLIPRKIYEIIPDERAEQDDFVRVVDESGEDYLFPADYFLPIELPQTVVRALKKSYARLLANA